MSKLKLDRRRINRAAPDLFTALAELQACFSVVEDKLCSASSEYQKVQAIKKARFALLKAGFKF